MLTVLKNGMGARVVMGFSVVFSENPDNEGGTLYQAIL
jgi:hypothetical protein